MLHKTFLGALLGLSLPLALAGAGEPTPAPYAPAFLTAQATHPTPQPSPTAAPQPAAVASPGAPAASPVPGPAAAPGGLSPSAKPALSPAEGASLSPAADAEGDSAVAEEVGEDGRLAPRTERPDPAKLDSETLATLAGGVADGDTQEVFYDPETKQTLNEAMLGAWQLGVDALYYELARRVLADNKDRPARQSFALALFKDPERAKYAKDLAYDDRSADVVIAQLEGGRQEARMDLQKMAERGNRKARLYLGMDKPMTRVDAMASTAMAQASSPTAQALSLTASPAPVSGTVAPADGPVPAKNSTPVAPMDPAGRP